MARIMTDEDKGKFKFSSAEWEWGSWLMQKEEPSKVKEAATLFGMDDASLYAVESERRGGLRQREVKRYVDGISEKMVEGGGDLVTAGCLLLKHLSAHIMTSETCALAISACLQALERYPSDLLTAKNGCAAVASLSFLSCSGIKGSSGKPFSWTITELNVSGWESVLRAMRTHLADADLAKVAAGALLGLSKWGKPSVDEALRILIEALRCHNQSVDVTHACMASLHLLSWRFLVHGSSVDIVLTSPDLLLETLERHISCTGLLLHTCGLLMILALSDRIRIAQPRAVRAALSAAKYRARDNKENAQLLVSSNGDKDTICVNSNDAIWSKADADNDCVAEHGWGLLLVLSEARTNDPTAVQQRQAMPPAGAAQQHLKIKKLLVDEGVLDAVWDVVDSEPGEYPASRHEVCWRIAQNLHAHAKLGPYWLGMHSDGRYTTVRRILPVMQAHVPRCGLQELHCWALLHIIAEGDGARELEGARTHPQSCECEQCKFGKGGIIVALVSAMDAYPRSLAVHVHAYAALLRLADGNVRNSQVMVRAGVVGLAVSAMRSHMRSADLQLVACKTLRTLCTQSTEALDQLQREGGVAVVLESLRFYRSELTVLEGLCELLRTACWSNEIRKTMGQDGGLGLLLLTMQHVQDRPDMQENGSSQKVQRDVCGCLHALSWNSDNKETIVSGVGLDSKAKGVGLIVRAMMFYPKDTDLQQQACSALAIISYFVDVNKLEICQNGGIQAIIYAMQTHDYDREIQEQGCLALWSLASRSQPMLLKGRNLRDDSEIRAEEERLKIEDDMKDRIQVMSKKSMCDGRGIEVLVAALRGHYNGVIVVERACRVLGQLSYGSWHTAQRICAEEGLWVIRKAMQAQMANVHVLEQACTFLKNLMASYNNTPKDKQKELPRGFEECVECIVRAMSKHSSHKGMHQQGCSALGNMAHGKRADQVGLKHRGIEAILASMAAHPEDLEVQKRACKSLKVLCASKSNVTRMRVLNHGQVPAARPIYAISRALCAHSGHVRDAELVISALHVLAEVNEGSSSEKEYVTQSNFPKVIAEVRKFPKARDWSKEEAEGIFRLWEKVAKTLNIRTE